tara:strand:+ start:7282 stop:8358 length:1077 start_codon:yes stop_codon:yes gene_type:complete
MKIVASFVHGYSNLNVSQPDLPRPSLMICNGKKVNIKKYIFPRNPEDFKIHKKIIHGELPSKNLKDFKKLPRFGFTGLFKFKNNIYCGSWNSIYMIDAKSFKLRKIFSNRLMCDLHGIFVNKNFMVHILTAKDTIVFSDHNGKIKNYFSIDKNLKVKKEKKVLQNDWRFLSKQFKGSTGFFHFNYVQIFNNEMWLTSRNCNCFVVVDLKTKRAELRTMNLSTPALIHDGVKKDQKYYFTSIDGKILIAENHNKKKVQHNREKIKKIQFFNRDLISHVVRLEDKNILGRQPNWCRGIEITKDKILLTIDGRYDTKLKFSIIILDKINYKLIKEVNFYWSEVGDQKKIRYCAGFDIISLK